MGLFVATIFDIVTRLMQEVDLSFPQCEDIWN